jgi:hypothetical protein
MRKGRRANKRALANEARERTREQLKEQALADEARERAMERALAPALKAIEKQFGHLIAPPRKPSPQDERRRAATAELARIAKIPPYARKRFDADVFFLLIGASQTASFREVARKWNDDRPVREAEKAVRAAHDTVRALGEPQRAVFEEAFRAVCECNEIVADGTFDEAPTEVGARILAGMVEAFARITGKSPDFEPGGGRGRPKGTVGNWQFQHLVELLWRAVNEYGGELTFGCKENVGSGTMMDALEILRPLLPPSLMPRHLPAKTIERVRATLDKKAPARRFLFTSSVSRETWDPNK